MASAPKSVTIRTYQVGFGDCFLVSFSYGPKSEKHILVDFGSTGFPKRVPKSRMMDIAHDIKKRTNGKLHAVVATHRHRDHISGFATAKGKGTGDVIRSLKPALVVQPWTEDPKLGPKATGPAGGKDRVKKLGAGTLKQIAALGLMHEVAQQTLAARNLPRDVRREVQFLGESNIQNWSAVDNLATMAKNSYVFCGSKSGLEKVLPGVKVSVLGPPTLKQTGTIKKQRSSDRGRILAISGERGTARRFRRRRNPDAVSAPCEEPWPRFSRQRPLACLSRAHDARRAIAADCALA